MGESMTAEGTVLAWEEKLRPVEPRPGGSGRWQTRKKGKKGESPLAFLISRHIIVIWMNL
jgi:hypothetical protein